MPYDVGIRAAQQIALFTPQGATTAQLALRWIVDQPGVSTVIPGARNAEQAVANAAAADLHPLTEDVQRALKDIYDDSIREHVHNRW